MPVTASVSRNPLSRQSANDPSVTALSLFRNLCAQPDAETRGAGDLGRDSAERPEACEATGKIPEREYGELPVLLGVASCAVYLFESRKCSAWCVVTARVRHRLRDEKGLHSILTSPESPHFPSSILLPSSPPLSSKISRDKSSERAV